MGGTLSAAVLTARRPALEWEPARRPLAYIAGEDGTERDAAAPPPLPSLIEAWTVGCHGAESGRAWRPPGDQGS